MNHFENELHDKLRRSEQNIDPDTARRLSQNRNHVISQAASPGNWWSQLTVTKGLALASVLAFAVVLYPTMVSNPLEPVSGGNFLSSESDDLYEDIDFYLWMANSETDLAG